MVAPTVARIPRWAMVQSFAVFKPRLSDVQRVFFSGLIPEDTGPALWDCRR